MACLRLTSTPGSGSAPVVLTNGLLTYQCRGICPSTGAVIAFLECVTIFRLSQQWFTYMWTVCHCQFLFCKLAMDWTDKMKISNSKSCLCRHACIHACSYVCILAHTHIHTRTHAHTHTHTHTHLYCMYLYLPLPETVYVALIIWGETAGSNKTGGTVGCRDTSLDSPAAWSPQCRGTHLWACKA